MADTFKIIDSSPKGIYIEIAVGSKTKMLTYPIEFPEGQILSSIYSEIEKLKENNLHTLFSIVNKGQDVEISKVEIERPIDKDSGQPIGAKEHKYDVTLIGKK